MNFMKLHSELCDERRLVGWDLDLFKSSYNGRLGHLIKRHNAHALLKSDTGDTRAHLHFWHVSTQCVVRTVVAVVGTYRDQGERCQHLGDIHVLTDTASCV